MLGPMDELDVGEAGRCRAAGMPSVYRDPPGRPDADTARTFRLDVEGQEFAVRVVMDPVTGYADSSYTWLSGPHDGYGFSTGGPSNPSLDEHRQAARDFLAMVDPTTGYIGDD